MAFLAFIRAALSARCLVGQSWAAERFDDFGHLLEHRHQEHIQYLAVDDPNVALNINTPEDYTALHSG